MHTLEPELRTLLAEGALDDATALRAIALDRGEAFSLHMEVRLLMYAGVTLVIGGVGMILARNLDRIGPLVIVLALLLTSIVCGLPAVRSRLAVRPLSTAAEYLLLLGVLLVSADLAYAEHAFKLLGPLWSWHFLLLAVFHAGVAYAFGSSLVLAASLTALAGWFGVGGSFSATVFDWPSTPELGTRALICGASIAAWRYADRYRNPDTHFTDVFDHFAANLAFVGALAWCNSMPWLLAGLPLVAIMATVAIRRGLRTGREMFVVYGIVYGAIGICIAVVPRLGDGTVAAAFVLLVVCVAAAVLWQLRQRIREPAQ